MVCSVPHAHLLQDSTGLDNMRHDDEEDVRWVWW
jgi:hypothetical protein